MIYKSNKGFVRKKLYMNKISASQDLRRRPDLIIQQEVDLLLFLAQEENHHPRIIKMYFAFKILEGEIETISLMFPQYPGSLEDILHERHTFSFAEFSPDSSVFRNSIINHWLWGEMVELLDGVQFLHDKLLWRNNGNGQAVIMGHFDLKPANILIDHRGHLLITDFGLAQMKAIESQSTQTTGLPGRAGTYSYSAPESAGTELNKLSRSYDVWSMACIILEAAVFILPVKFWEPSQPNKKDKRATTLYTTTNVIGGKFAVETFETHRIAECNSHHKEPCFWLVDGKSKILKQCVNDRLSMLEMSDDIYLSTVGDALREMFLIDPKARRGRPTAEKCRQMLLTNTYMYTQGSEHERELVELCGDHTARPVRKMSVQNLSSFLTMFTQVFTDLYCPLRGVRVSKSYPASSILCTLEISQFRPAGKDPKIRLIMNYQLRGQSSASATGIPLVRQSFAFQCLHTQD
jgi:serine/threonine protein kinase